MNNKKRAIAMALATTMVLGSSMTAFAADNTGSTSGDGTSEGHVEQKKVYVVLPTVPENDTTFNYTMDPEGLIGETEGAKYESGTTFPQSGDTGVYFLTGEKTYANASKALTVSNQSSCDVELTVEVEATSADTDIPLVAESALASATEASLYLGLVVGSEDPVAITKDAKATKTVTLTGKPGNFKVAVNSAGDGYEYRALTLDEYKALDGNSAATEIAWENVSFNLEGATTTGKEITATTTAPTVEVTWSWVDPAATPATPGFTEADYTYTAGSNMVIDVNLPEGATGLSVVAYKTEGAASWSYFTADTDYTYANNKITFPADSGKLYTVASGRTEDLAVTIGFKADAGDTIYEAGLVIEAAGN